MKRQYLLFSLLIVSLAALSSGLWLKLHGEQMIIKDLRAQQSTASSSNTAPLVEDRPPAAIPPSSDSGEAVACPPKATQVAMPTEEVIARMDRLVTQIRDSVKNTPELVNDLEYRRARLIQMRISEAQNNPGLVEALGLTEAEARDLFEIMAARQLDNMIEISKSSTDGLSFSAVAETTRRFAVAQEQSVRALLGSERYPKLLEYQAKVRPAYVQAKNIETALTSSDQPLSEGQLQALKSALLEEQRRPRQPLAVDNSRAMDMNSVVQARKADNNRRVLEAAAPHLSPAQLEILRRSLESQSSAIR